MVKSSRSAVKTITLNRSRDIVVDRLTNQCEAGNHSRCTGWAVLKKENSPINANYFLRCTCSCHKKVSPKRKKPVRTKRTKKIKKPTKVRKTKGRSRKGRR